MAAQGQSVLTHRTPSKPNGACRNAGAVWIGATASTAIASITDRENQSSKFVDHTHYCVQFFRRSLYLWRSYFCDRRTSGPQRLPISDARNTLPPSTVPHTGMSRIAAERTRTHAELVHLRAAVRGTPRYKPSDNADISTVLAGNWPLCSKPICTADERGLNSR